MTKTRRDFLKHVSVATAVGLLTQIPPRRLWAMTPAELLPEPDEALLKELARQAMEAARAAGASFADIRLTAARYVTVGGVYDPRLGAPAMDPPGLGYPTEYGIRAIADGVWGFASGTDLMPDAVVATARTAVAVARGNKPRRPRTLELAPHEYATDARWATPIEQEPLEVPIHEQGELQLAALREVVQIPEVISARVSFQWRRPTSVFACTDGTTLVFRYATALPAASVSVRIGERGASAGVEGLRQGPYGYEALGGETLISGMRPAAERAIVEAKTIRELVSVEVGRYDLVLSPGAVSAILTTTLADAVHAERALGYWANGAGTSYAAPPTDILGRFQAATPLLTVRGDRSRPGGVVNVPWDEEGVKPRDYTFIEHGVFVDYHTNRETAPQLAPWYRRQGRPVRAQGLARGCGSERPGIYLPNLTMEPGPGDVTVEEMIKDVKKGLYIPNAGGGSDQQLINNQFAAWDARYITNGKLGTYVKDAAFQFTTTPFWKSVDVLGGRSSVQTSTTVTDGGALFDPVQPFPFSTFSIVPVRARQVNVLNTGRTA